MWSVPVSIEEEGEVMVAERGGPGYAAAGAGAMEWVAPGFEGGNGWLPAMVQSSRETQIKTAARMVGDLLPAKTGRWCNLII
jgi:hypothetical protein